MYFLSNSNTKFREECLSGAGIIAENKKYLKHTLLLPFDSKCISIFPKRISY